MRWVLMRAALFIVALIAPAIALAPWRFSDESSDSTTVDEIIELTEKIFKSRILSQEGPGRPEGQVLPSEIFTVTRVTTKK